MGYIVHKMLMCSLGRLDEDDRDHFGKKRLDLAGPLMAGLFRTLFRKFTKEVKRYLQRSLDEGNELNIAAAIKPLCITQGLVYSLATGNWGDKGASSKVCQPFTILILACRLNAELTGTMNHNQIITKS